MLTPPSVSILRPLKGLDINLRENLLSSFGQNYPAYEIIFSVAKEDDPAIPVVKELMEEHPEIETRLIIGKALG
jgi:ceramide glucosyltransferase